MDELAPFGGRARPEVMATDVHEIAGYEVVGRLGEGARSVIYEVRDKKLQRFALKRVEKQ